MSITLTGNDDLLVGQAHNLLAAESGLEVSYVGLADLLDGRSHVAEGELLFLLTKEQEPDNVVGWASQITSQGHAPRLVLCMPRPNARTSRLLLKHADGIIIPAGSSPDQFAERVLGLLILEKRIETYSHGALYGATKRMRGVYEDIERYGRLREPVLILGETGTGKELVARAIHEASARRSQPFVACNCTAIPKDLVESQLFGHRRGAFTGAISDFLGFIRSAAGGTFFLDEIGDLPLELQPKLLRLLQEREVQPVGELKPQKVDVRFLFATSRKLREEVEKGTFRSDLYARLDRVVLELPPLRERKADIPLLVEHFREKYNSLNVTAVQVQPTAIDELFCIDWEKNVRDLDNVVARAAAKVGQDGIITDALMSESLKRAWGYSSAFGQATEDGPFRMVVFRPLEDEWRTVRHRAEAAYFRAIIEVADGEEDAFRLSGMKRARFYEILKNHGLSFND
jgi:transcriptional regulator with GAF, ATPase, and Fis domain